MIFYLQEKSAHREKELKTAETALSKAKQKAEASKKEFRAKQQVKPCDLLLFH